MTIHHTSFGDWQNYPSTLDPIHVVWLKQDKKSKTAFAVANIEIIEISYKRFLTRVLLFSKKIQSYSLEQNFDETPKLGNGKTDYSATKKIALVNGQQ